MAAAAVAAAASALGTLTTDISTLAASLLQEHSQHGEELRTAAAQQAAALALARQHHAEQLRLAVQQHMEATRLRYALFSAELSHEQVLAERESSRDMYEMRARTTETMLIVVTVLCGAMFSLIIDGMRQMQTEFRFQSRFLIPLAIFMGFGLLTNFVCMYIQLSLYARMTAFTHTNPLRRYPWCNDSCAHRHVNFDHYYQTHCRHLAEQTHIGFSITLAMAIGGIATFQCGKYLLYTWNGQVGKSELAFMFVPAVAIGALWPLVAPLVFSSVRQQPSNGEQKKKNMWSLFADAGSDSTSVSGQYDHEQRRQVEDEKSFQRELRHTQQEQGREGTDADADAAKNGRGATKGHSSTSATAAKLRLERRSLRERFLACMASLVAETTTGDGAKQGKRAKGTGKRKTTGWVRRRGRGRRRGKTSGAKNNKRNDGGFCSGSSSNTTSMSRIRISSDGVGSNGAAASAAPNDAASSPPPPAATTTLEALSYHPFSDVVYLPTFSTSIRTDSSSAPLPPPPLPPPPPPGSLPSGSTHSYSIDDNDHYNNNKNNNNNSYNDDDDDDEGTWDPAHVSGAPNVVSVTAAPTTNHSTTTTNNPSTAGSTRSTTTADNLSISLHSITPASRTDVFIAPQSHQTSYFSLPPPAESADSATEAAPVAPLSTTLLQQQQQQQQQEQREQHQQLEKNQTLPLVPPPLAASTTSSDDGLSPAVRRQLYLEIEAMTSSSEAHDLFNFSHLSSSSSSSSSHEGAREVARGMRPQSSTSTSSGNRRPEDGVATPVNALTTPPGSSTASSQLFESFSDDDDNALGYNVSTYAQYPL